MNDRLISLVKMRQASGRLASLAASTDGHLEVAVHEPRLPFGSVHTESLTPVFQSDAVYGVLSDQVTATSSLGGSATASDSSFVVSTGTTQNAQGMLQSRKRLRYRAGQGVVGRFAGLYTTPVASSYQVVGFGHAEDGVYFGYQGTTFGILYANRGVSEVRTLTITTASSTAENVVVTLNGTANNIAVTNSGNIQRTVWEISKGTYSGWKAFPSGATVVFVRDAAGTASGTYSLTGTTVGGTFAQTKAGAASTDAFVAQTSWNCDVLDGSRSSRNPSGFLLDPTKGNVFQIGIQYLGYGCITFAIETWSADSNNPTFTTVHVLKLPGTLTATSLSNPSFPFTMAAYSTGSTTNLTVKVGSFAGFIEGNKRLHGPRSSYFNSSAAVDATNYTALFTVYNPLFNTTANRTNQAVVNLISCNCALKHISPCIIYLIKNGTVAGNPTFSAFSTNSTTLWSTTAHTITSPTNSQILWSGHLGDTGNFDHSLSPAGIEELTLQPGEYITVAARAVSGSPSYVTASLNTREDI